MKTIKMDSKSGAAAYLSRAPSETHTPAELESLHACIRYTHIFKKEESLNKMDEESAIALPLPKLGIGRFS